MVSPLITSKYFFAGKIPLVILFPDNPDPARVGKRACDLCVAVFSDSFSIKYCGIPTGMTTAQVNVRVILFRRIGSAVPGDVGLAGAPDITDRIVSIPKHYFGYTDHSHVCAHTYADIYYSQKNPAFTPPKPMEA